MNAAPHSPPDATSPSAPKIESDAAASLAPTTTTLDAADPLAPMTATPDAADPLAPTATPDAADQLAPTTTPDAADLPAPMTTTPDAADQLAPMTTTPDAADPLAPTATTPDAADQLAPTATPDAAAPPQTVLQLCGRRLHTLAETYLLPTWRKLAAAIMPLVTQFIAWATVQPPSPPPHSPSGSRLQALADTYPLPTWRPLARSVMLASALFILWAALAVLDEVAIANGEVVPEGKVKVIQHLEGGVVRDIYVVEGAIVSEGTPLLQLDLSASSLNREEVRVRLDGLTLQRVRLEAEANNTALIFPEEESKRQPALVAAETRNFESRRHALRTTLAVMTDQARQKALEVQEMETRQRALAANLRLARERLAMSTELMKSGLTAKMEHVSLQGQAEDLEGQLETVRASIPRAQAAQAEAKSRMEEEQARFQRTAQSELAEAELNVARTRELLAQASDQQRRTQITSPIDGIVKNLRANTIGGVVKPGDPIMEIVPLHERLQIDARLSPADRGYVQLGQKAMVKLSAYDYTTYGGLQGDVILVAPDTTMGPDNQPFYRVVVQTDRAYLGEESAKRPITAGMQATVEINTGTRTVMEYLFKPVLKLRHEAFRER